MQDIIIKIINIPHGFYTLRDISAYTFLKNTGYFEIQYRINENDIVKELTNYPNIVNDWLSWSENKRVDSGWYFKATKNVYVVGYFALNKTVESEIYSDVIQACASFIKHEIENIRK